MGREADMVRRQHLDRKLMRRKGREKVRAPSLFLTGGPEEMKGETQ